MSIMFRKLLFLAALSCLSHPVLAVSEVKRGCVASADVFAREDTLRVRNQGTSSTRETPANLAIEIVAQTGQVRGSPLVISLPKKETVSLTINEIYQQAGVSWKPSANPDLMEVIETDSNYLTHELQAVVLYTGSRAFPSPNRATPLIFTCSHDPSILPR